MIYFLLTTTIIFLITTIVFIQTSLKMQSINEQLNDIVNTQLQKENITKETLEELLQQLKEIDLRGSFESDDEVGAVFTQIKNLIKQYNDSI
jgi:predicted house-cleaning NTP pyrophosphatase (Maf/HAM1 superfamily)